MHRKFQGQEAVEFIIISGLVVVVSIASWSLVGKNITSLLTSTNQGYKKFEPFGFASENSKAPEDFVQQNIPEEKQGPQVINSNVIAGTQVQYFDDGSAQAAFGNSSVSLSAEILENLDNVFDTVASPGLNEYVLLAMQDIINEHKVDDKPVDIQISFGKGTRKDNLLLTDIGSLLKKNKNKGYTSYNAGETMTSMNFVSLKVDNHLVILQNDKISSSLNNDYLKGVYKIDGYIADNNKYITDNISKIDHGEYKTSFFNDLNSKISTLNSEISQLEKEKQALVNKRKKAKLKDKWGIQRDISDLKSDIKDLKKDKKKLEKESKEAKGDYNDYVDKIQQATFATDIKYINDQLYLNGKLYDNYKDHEDGWNVLHDYEKGSWEIDFSNSFALNVD